jgi:CRISPR-associated protein Cas2
MRYLITYDVPDNRRRKRLSDAIDVFATRVQKSVFEAVLDARQHAELLASILAIVDPRADSVMIHTLCGSCEPRSQRLGLAAKSAAPGSATCHIF